MATEVSYYLGKRDWVSSQAVLCGEVETMSVSVDRIGVRSHGTSSCIHIWPNWYHDIYKACY